jgi:hypothetical protein
VTHSNATVPARPASSVWHAEADAERAGWYELVDLVRRLTPAECLVPGYYRDPDWTVRDAVAHIGTWLAQAEVQLERMAGGTYEGHDVDIDAINAQMLEAMADQPWEVAWTIANSARTLMLQDWYRLPDRNAESAWWVAKAGGHHYDEHLPRLREWVAELVKRRT